MSIFLFWQGDQSWVFIGKTDAEAEAPILWPPDANSRLIKDPDAGKDWRQEEKGTTEGEMVGWHPWLELQELVLDREAWHAVVHGVRKTDSSDSSQKDRLQSDMTEWTEMN